MLEPRESDIPALFLVLVVLPLVAYILLGKWSEAAKKGERISLLAQLAAEEALREEAMATASVILVSPSKNGLHVCARCFGPATTRCSRCKSIRYWYSNFRDMETTKVGPFGGKGGNQWDDGTYTTVKQLRIVCGDVIDSIQIEYDKNGKSVWSEKHGGSGGHNHHEVKLDYPDEFIVSISGHHKLYIHSLKIETNKKMYGPFGTEEGNSFSIPASDSKIVGFLGRSGSYIDAIGAYVASIPISYPYVSFGPFGGQGGNWWDDGTYTTVRQLRVICGTVIDSIQIEYDKNGESVWSTKHGGLGGHKHHEVKLDYPNEYIISISGHHKLIIGNDVVHSLKIETNKKTYGPFGTEEGNSFSIPASGGKIVGFLGRSGSYIDAIGAYIASIPISYPYVSFGPFGGQGGNQWDDGTYTTVRQLRIICGTVIDSIQIEYDKNGESVWSTKHGGLGGHKHHEVKLDYPNEYIISISGHHKLITGNDVVHSLKIETNKKTYGPFGTEEGNSFSIPASGGKIVGFLGRSGSYIDAIGAYVASIPISYPYVSFGPFGGQGGNRWDDGTYTTVKQLHIVCGDAIDSIQIEYDKNGKSVWSAKHGGSGGHNRYEVKLDYPDEFIVSISGHHKLYIHSLKIETNKKTHGPFGTEEGNSFSIPASGGKIVGFLGRSGSYIDAIGAYIASIPISYPYVSFGPFGGQGGNQWDDGTYTTVKQLRVICGTVIDSIQIEYDKNGESVWSTKHGGLGGHKHHEVKLDYLNEYIISISGHHKLYNTGNYVVHSLKIETNKKTYGPFGTEEGNSFSIPASGGKIVGFLGRSGSYIDAIGAYVASIPISYPYASFGPFGGQGGNQWDDGTYTTVKQLRIVCGDVIDSIQIEYDKNEKSVWSAKHGGSGGHNRHEVKLDYPDEFIVSISGHHKLYVHSLKIETNKKMYGPFGTEEGNAFSIPSSDGKIVGFLGRSGNYIDAIGAYVEP